MKSVLIALWGSLLLFSSFAYSFDYFEKDIDYWNENKKEVVVPPNPAPKQIIKQKESPQTSNNVKKFNWNDALNPKKEDFWREGDYVPPPAFIETANNPNEKNIKNWFKLIEKKTKISQRLNLKIAEYVAKNQGKLKPPEIQALNEARVSMPPSLPDQRRYKFRMYFESSCPHCHRMMNTLKELQAVGYYIELKQIDKNKKATKGFPFPVLPLDKGELQKMKITGWPVLFVSDLKKKVLIRIDGYKNFQQVISRINSQN